MAILAASPLLSPAGGTASTPSAGGAPIDQLLVVAAFTAAACALLAWVVLRERQGRPTLVGRAAAAVARIDGGPRWFALPALVSLLGAASGGIGVSWDVSYHITEGRDEGPLANPSHYLIFLGLLAMFVGGALGMALARRADLPRRTLRLTRSWRTPLGPAVTTGISLCALIGFPLDDLWHRLFGQDVTEWGPTHVLMIGGAVVLPYAVLLSAAEARQLGGSRVAAPLRLIALGYLLIGPVAFLLEYAFGVPQFPLIMDTVVLTIGVATGTVLAGFAGPRLVLGAWAVYALVQLLFVGLNVVAWEAMVPRPPLLLGGALAGALLSAVVLPRVRRPGPVYGGLAGAAVGLATVPVEVWWADAARAVSYPAAIVPAALVAAAVTGAGAGLVATWLHQQLAATSAPALPPAPGPVARPAGPPAPAGRRTGSAALAGLAVVVAVFAVLAPPRSDLGLDATVDVAVGPVADGRAELEVRADPALADGALWFESMSWQGGGLVRADLEPVAPGVWRTAEPVPVSGSWKTMVRLHRPLSTMVAAPVHLPADPAIPAPAYAAADGPRPLVAEAQLLQRERRTEVPAWLWGAGYLVVAAVFTVLLGMVALGVAVAGGTDLRRTRAGRFVGGTVSPVVGRVLGPLVVPLVGRVTQLASPALQRVLTGARR